jgi:hypothetical protein
MMATSIRSRLWIDLARSTFSQKAQRSFERSEAGQVRLPQDAEIDETRQG